MAELNSALLEEKDRLRGVQAKLKVYTYMDMYIRICKLCMRACVYAYVIFFMTEEHVSASLISEDLQVYRHVHMKI